MLRVSSVRVLPFIAIAAASMLAACSKKEEAPPAAAATTAPAAAPEPAPAPKIENTKALMIGDLEATAVRDG